MIANADSIRIPLADGAVQCVVTSPPYWGLRAYSGEQERVWPDGWRGGLGLEPTPELFIEHMVQVFREVRRVMRDDAVAWVNMGDCYAQHKGTMRGDTETAAKAVRRQISRGTSTLALARLTSSGHHGGWEGRASRAANTVTGNLKPKDLVMMPHRLALALQADGWWVRSDVAWSKPNPMPESLSGWRWEQCRAKTQAHADHEKALQERMVEVGGDRARAALDVRTDRAALDVWESCTGCPKCRDNDGLVLRRGSWRPTSAHEYVFMLAKSSTYFSDGEAVREGRSLNGDNPAGRNLRSVWNIATQPFKGAHYATFPTALAQRCVLASTSRHACAECGAPWARVVESRYSLLQETNNPRNVADDGKTHYSQMPRMDKTTTTLDHRPSCGCGARVRPCIVLDPFCGSGTVGQVCRELPHRRDFVGLDLSFEYLQDQALVRSERRTPPSALAELPMFA
jgi:DNA modification methylase